VNYEWQPLFLIFKLAALTTLILFVIGVPFAWWLAVTRSGWFGNTA